MVNKKAHTMKGTKQSSLHCVLFLTKFASQSEIHFVNELIISLFCGAKLLRSNKVLRSRFLFRYTVCGIISLFCDSKIISQQNGVLLFRSRQENTVKQYFKQLIRFAERNSLRERIKITS